MRTAAPESTIGRLHRPEAAAACVNKAANVQVYFDQLAANLRFADVLDIGVIAVLLYCGLSWFRQRASRSLAMGLTVVLGVFLCARWLDMYLTTMLFQAGLTAVLLTLVVVFQDDIRRGFERLAASAWFGRSQPETPTSEVVDIVVEALTQLSNNYTGALLVFEGREPLDKHVRGGVRVDGLVSLPLLCSIFHPGSPGHDGAVIISGKRVETLGVHLPLSTNRRQIGHRGTRHAAALGVSERCDALVLAVSEERGVISAAEQGAIREIEPADIPPKLAAFFQSRPDSKPQTAWHRGLTRNLGWKFVAAVLAAVLWLLFAYRVETIQRTIVVPIEYRNLPEDWVVDEPRITRAELTVSGSERTFKMLDASSLVISFDMSQVRDELPRRLNTADSLEGLPAELEVNQIQPEEVEITVRRNSEIPP